ncbi:hypothetical protein EXE58_09210 [Nocardioides seonyuensis]|uniref:Glycosyltransferase RgtA/B/C/D-like domain-containing protein n=1 Tax=Nocardioides seonyuensis TaxID=2518371 RepID=A0A4P7IG56_9ACTN|nr:hypothetical protein [Nocardioides seonyuensis]QBX55613.1 hypothetical protein EXE58_09210 [Nocardioides seonyuensis]
MTGAVDHRPGKTWWAAVVSVFVVQAATVVVLTSRNYFFMEDFRFLVQLREGPIDAELLGYDVFGHFVPGLALGNHLFAQAFGASWTAASVVILAFQLGGSVAFLRLLIALHGRTWWLPGALAAFALSVVMLYSSVWWAATWTMGATTVCAVSAFGCAQRYFNTRRRRHLLSLAVMAALSFSFFEKSVVLCVYVGLFALVVGKLDERESWRQRLRGALAVWPVWLTLGTLASIDLALYFAGGHHENLSEPPPLALTGEYLLRALPEGSFTTVLGVVHPSVGPPGPQWLVPATTTTLFVLIMAWTSWRSRLAARAWLWFLACALVSVGFVALGRLGTLGVDMTAQMLRYQVETNYLVLVALTIAVPAALHTLAHGARARLWHLRGVIAVGVVIALVPGWIASVRVISETGPGRTADEYFAALRTGGPPPGPFLEYPVPAWIVPAFQYPWNMSSVIFPLVNPRAETTTDPRGSYVVTYDGTVREVALDYLYGPAKTAWCGGPEPAAITLVTGMQSPRQPDWDPLLVVVDHVAEGRATVSFTGKDENGTPTSAAGMLGSVFVVEGRGRLAFPTTVALSEVVLFVEGVRVCIERFGIAVAR